MKIKFRLFLILLLFTMSSTCSFSITQTGLYNEGKRAFLLGHWQESYEIFSKFLATWPESPLKVKANYFKTVSNIRYIAKTNIERKAAELASLTQILNLTKEQLPNFDTSELEIAIQRKKNTHFDTQILSSLTQLELKHVLANKWYPEPYKFPLKTLKWISNWRKKHTGFIFPELQAQLSYTKALALWQILLSPLSKQANKIILSEWGCWPVHTAFEEALRNSFSKGSPSLKRNVALLGCHYEFFLHNFLIHNKLKIKKNKWYDYLKTRGISNKEAWCPR